MEKLPSPGDSIGNKPGPDVDEVNRASLIRFAMAFAMSLLMASTAPPGLVLATLEGLLFLCAAIAAVVAATMGDRLSAGHLTRWDEAAAMALASMAVNWFIDPALVQAALDAAAVTGQ